MKTIKQSPIHVGKYTFRPMDAVAYTLNEDLEDLLSLSLGDFTQISSSILHGPVGPLNTLGSMVIGSMAQDSPTNRVLLEVITTTDPNLWSQLPTGHPSKSFPHRNSVIYQTQELMSWSETEKWWIVVAHPRG